MMKQKAYFGIALFALLWSACEKKDIYNPPAADSKVTLENYFDFSTTKMVQMNLSYDVKGKTLFEVYGENPFTLQDGQLVKKTNLIALETGYTDEEGKYNFNSLLPASVKEVYIYSPYYNVPTLFKASVSGNELKADIRFENAEDLSAIAVTKALTKALTWENMKKYIPNRLAEWNNAGTPGNIDEEVPMLVDETINRYIKKYLPEGIHNSGAFTNSPELTLDEETEKVTFYYVGGKTSAKSVFAYYCYPENASLEQIQKAASNACVIFPNVSPAPVLKSGAAVRLKYINPAGEVTEDNFPAGTKIGFMLWNNGWSNSVFNKNNVFYSTKELNTGKYSCTALLKVQDGVGTERTLIGFEDWPVRGDRDYNDVVFAIDVLLPDVPPLPDPEPDPIEKRYQGILGFEDNWPNQGDYDMNDVVVKYNSSMFLNDKNEIISITDRFTLSWTGANLNNGFGFEYPFSLENAELTLPKNAEVKDNVVYLFKSAKQEMKVENVPALEMIHAEPKEASYMVTVTFKTPIAKGEVNPPYNPFITINGSDYEVHLTNYKPTEFASNVFPAVGKADISDGVTTWFVCEDGFPFAIHMDARHELSLMELDLKPEAVRIDKTYPGFADWAKSRNPQIKWW